ncbi:carbohydrate-binding protein [Dongshaea marina]|uniref:carbohydrate-binding protein n=1 Tax=Dongshaea marina TaxID=2047966 RepID=UPI00131F3732|nr:carbohydrate-binding protein [Dongshaea marina]
MRSLLLPALISAACAMAPVMSQAQMQLQMHPQAAQTQATDTDSQLPAAFSGSTSYTSGDQVSLDSLSYEAQDNVAAHTFVPGQPSPWVPYAKAPEWDQGKAYSQGDKVQLDGVEYQAVWWSQGKDPSDPANQQPTDPSKLNGQPWLLLGPCLFYTSQEQGNFLSIE